MAVLVGVDEAGFGPTLGPLVVSSVAVGLPDELLGASLWKILGKQITRRRSARGGKLHIDDSKKVFVREQGIASLERPVLVALSAAHGLPADFEALLDQLGASCRSQLHEYPWYCGALPALPSAIEATAVRIAANALRAELRRQDLRLLQLRAEPMLEGQFNRMVGATGNKSRVLFSVVARLIGEAYNRFGGENLHVVVDKQGGRDHYRKLLQLMFPELTVGVVAESSGHSVYTLSGASGQLRLCFLAGGDQKQLPVALASMLCKYLRELFMSCFNQFWQKQLPRLQPTAGYYVDAQRFIRQIAPLAQQLQISPQRMVRTK